MRFCYGRNGSMYLFFNGQVEVEECLYENLDPDLIALTGQCPFFEVVGTPGFPNDAICSVALQYLLFILGMLTVLFVCCGCGLTINCSRKERRETFASNVCTSDH